MKAAGHEIPRRPLLCIAGALFLTVPPMFGTLAPWIPACFAASLAAKFWMERRGWRLRSFAWKVMLAGVVLGGVHLTYHGVRGLEPSLSLLLLLTSLKVLESHTARDFHILALLGWLLCLAGLFISQDLSAGVYAVAAFVLILAAVVQFHRGPAARRPFSAPLLTSLGLVLQSLPVVVALFFLFPRVSPFGFDLSHSSSGNTGMSNELKPGSVSKLALSNEVAFRAEFPDGNMPALANLYWRAAVFTQDHGLSWTYSPIDILPRPSGPLGASRIRQRIILQPNGGQWVFALEWPADAPHDTTMFSGNVIRSNRPVFNQWHYEVTSFSTNKESGLNAPAESENCLQRPPGISPRIRELVKSWQTRDPNPRAVVNAAMQYFHKEKFLYTLTPGKYDDKDGLEDFLFRRRSGFCEHYAAAFATLMRVAGIPSRVVIGYHGGQFNALGKYLVVHQSDAHAWCEVWLRGIGWIREDPTASVPEGPIGAEFVDMRDTSAASAAEDAAAQLAGVWGRQPLLRDIHLAWDAVSYEWDSRVANFDDETQQSLFLGLGWPDTRPIRLAAWLAVAAGFLLGAQSLWTWWRTRAHRDPLKVRYERFCHRIARLGVKREPWEGPSQFAGRAAASLPDHADHIKRVTGLYVSLRYSPACEPGDLKEFRRMARV